MSKRSLQKFARSHRASMISIRNEIKSKGQDERENELE